MKGLRIAFKEYLEMQQVRGVNPILAFDFITQKYIVFWYFKEETIINLGYEIIL